MSVCSVFCVYGVGALAHMNCTIDINNNGGAGNSDGTSCPSSMGESSVVGSSSSGGGGDDGGSSRALDGDDDTGETSDVRTPMLDATNAATVGPPLHEETAFR